LASEEQKPAQGRKKTTPKATAADLGKGAQVAKRRAVFSRETLDGLLRHLEGGGSVLRWCEQNNYAQSTVHRALERLQAAQDFARARAVGAQSLVDEALAIVDAADPTDPQDVARRKLRAETRLKLAACYAPAIYGLSKQAGASGGASVSVTIATGVPEGGTASRRITVEATDSSATQRLELADDDADG
jgi:hypothetical protein